MRKIFFLLALAIGMQSPILAQGPIGNFSEDQIMDLIERARLWTRPDSFLNEEQQKQGKKFLREYQPLLNNLGRKSAFYYLKMVESSAERNSGYMQELACEGRALYWYHRNDYSPEETKELDRLKK